MNAINTKVEPLDDVRVRQALVMALDRKKMSQALTNGIAQPIPAHDYFVLAHGPAEGAESDLFGGLNQHSGAERLR